MFCNAVSDVAPLSNVSEVTLQALANVTDISMLNKVRKLTVIQCEQISKFPIPCDYNQEWIFSCCNVYDITGYDKLLRLEINNSLWLRDVSNLGKVRYLSIKNCQRVTKTSIPKPEGKLQEWEFDSLSIPDVSIFQGMSKLELYNCSTSSTVLSGLRNIHQLSIRSCSSIDTICDLSDIDFLDISSCYDLQHIFHLQNVHEIGLHACGDIRWKCSQIGAAANCKVLKLSYLSSLEELNPLSDVIRNLHTLRLLHCYQLQDITTTNADGTRDYITLLNIDTLVIDPRNKLKVYDEEYINANRHIQPLCKYPFNNQTMREAVDLWFAFPQRALRLYDHISTWDVRFVTNMGSLFHDKTNFNEDISAWDVSNVRNMSFMFAAAKSFNQPLDTWSVAKVTNMSFMFQSALIFNQPLNSWNVEKVTDMQRMFHNATAFNQPLDKWNTCNVSNMQNMFSNAVVFNQPLNDWNVCNVSNMRCMFENATSFNQPLNQWNLAEVETTAWMFHNAKSYNQA